MIKLWQKSHKLSPKLLFWTSKQPFAKLSFPVNYNVCPMAIPEISWQMQGSNYWQLIHCYFFLINLTTLLTSLCTINIFFFYHHTTWFIFHLVLAIAYCKKNKLYLPNFWICHEFLKSQFILHYYVRYFFICSFLILLLFLEVLVLLLPYYHYWNVLLSWSLK